MVLTVLLALLVPNRDHYWRPVYVQTGSNVILVAPYSDLDGDCDVDLCDFAHAQWLTVTTPEMGHRVWALASDLKGPLWDQCLAIRFQ